MKKLVALLSCLCLALVAATFVAQAQKASDSSPRILIGPNLRASDNVRKGGRNECWISASQTKTNVLVVVCQATPSPNDDDQDPGTPRGCTTILSRNGGQTWHETALPKQEMGCFDTMTVSAPDGRIYVSQPMIGHDLGDGLETASTLTKSTIRIYTTTDGGQKWKGPADIFCPVAPDHPRMVVDDSDGPHKGRLYVEWNEVYDTVLKDRFNMFLSYSDDGGETFSDSALVTTAVSQGGKLVATEPVVLSDGTLLITYYQYWNPLSDPQNNSQPFFIVRSDDSAKTFSQPVKITEVGAAAWLYLRKDFSRTFTLPIVTADTSRSSAFRDHIYMVWEDVRSGDADVWLLKSTDKGVTWSKPKQLNDNPPTAKGAPPNYRMTPVVSVNKDGVVGVAWYDYRDDPTHTCWKEYFTASMDGGETFLPNVAVSTQPSCPSKEAMLPSVYVWNVSPDPDDTLPTKEEVEHHPELQRLGEQQKLSVARAIHEEEQKRNESSIDINFAYDRNLWPGHYTGLTADQDGTFHVLWSDRRNAPLQQIFTATVQVATHPDAQRPQLHEADVTKLVRLVGGPATYDAANKTTTFELQVRNVSNQPVYGPLRVRITSIGSNSAGSTATIVNADSKASKDPPSWDFSKFLGSSERLAPGMISEAKRLIVRTNDATGLDASLQFEVVGQVE